MPDRLPAARLEIQSRSRQDSGSEWPRDSSLHHVHVPAGSGAARLVSNSPRAGGRRAVPTQCGPSHRRPSLRTSLTERINGESQPPECAAETFRRMAFEERRTRESPVGISNSDRTIPRAYAAFFASAPTLYRKSLQPIECLCTHRLAGGGCTLARTRLCGESVTWLKNAGNCILPIARRPNWARIRRRDEFAPACTHRQPVCECRDIL